MMSASCSLRYPKQSDSPCQSKLGGKTSSHHQFKLDCMTKPHHTGDFQHLMKKQHIPSLGLWHPWKTLRRCERCLSHLSQCRGQAGKLRHRTGVCPLSIRRGNQSPAFLADPLTQPVLSRIFVNMFLTAETWITPFRRGRRGLAVLEALQIPHERGCQTLKTHMLNTRLLP